MSQVHAPTDLTSQTVVPTEEAAQEIHPMALLLEEYEETIQMPRSGQIRNGTVVAKTPHELLVDIGFKSEGIVGGRELERVSDSFESLDIGDEVPVYVMREDRDGNLLLSITRALAEKDWERAEELMETQDIFEGIVSACNRGGVIVRIGQLRGFVPASQLSPISQATRSNDEVENDSDDRWEPLMEETLKLKVIDIDRRRNRLILSERQAMREWRRHQKDKLLKSLAEGDVYEGIITSIADFGAFVDLGGADGLIHLSELSWNRVSHPNEVVKIGEKVKVAVISVDVERRRIGLSMRRLQPEPWDLVNESYEVGQIVEGRITKLVNFGAFARLEDTGIEGLIHISELADQRVGHPKEVVAEGELHELRIIRIDTDRRRMGLSLKQALPVQEPELDWEIAPSSEADGDLVIEEVVESSEIEEPVLEFAN
ncbi:MAG: S1 RNA-binding domain-containing protein [Caldilineaceae bacterium]|nr:S1 RNA-binding domain-containing protein [Caldilineaceae bacterium]